MKYQSKPKTVEATQWFRNGDHPLDDCEIFQRPAGLNGEMMDYPGEGKVVRYFRHPDISGKLVCDACGKTMHDHGWIDSTNTLNPSGCTVCPGDYVVTEMSDATKYYPCKPDVFEASYQLIGR